VTWTVLFRPSADKELRRLPADIRRRVGAKIDLLEHGPHPAGAKRLKGEDAVYRLRVGDYRIVYEVQAHRIVILIIRIRHRREVYRGD